MAACAFRSAGPGDRVLRGVDVGSILSFTCDHWIDQKNAWSDVSLVMRIGMSLPSYDDKPARDVVHTAARAVSTFRTTSIVETPLAAQ